MGYDIECIVDINNYPGEYFCPVCRTLVYPNEALLSQCAHLYCKPCLSYVVNSTKTCPYDGYVVTESDSKPLIESDKTLAENIGKVKVYCLFCRSGCTWTGALSESSKHISECTFGNSPVVCNRCQIQIMHRQVNEHAQVCTHAYVQAVVPVAAPTGSDTTATTATAVTQAQVSQNAPMPAQNPNQVNPSSQAAVVAPMAVSTPDQWYQQQQYQQYYQQQAGYYQYPAQPYYPVQQYQRTPFPAQGPPQTQAPSVAQSQPPLQVQPQPLMMQQPQVQPYMQGQAQPPPQVNQSQPQLAPQAPQLMQPQTYVPPNGAQPLYVQYPQVPQYQQAGVQMHHPQPPQAPVRPQMQPPLSHPPPQAQTMNQMNAQIPQQPQQYPVQAQPYFRPPPPPPPTHPNATVPQQQIPPVNGHHAYHQPQTGMPQQHVMHPRPNSEPLRPVQQVPQQPPVMRPQHPPTGPYPHQQVSTMVQQQNQAPVQYQQYPPQGHAYPHQLPHVPQAGQQIVQQQYSQQQPSIAPLQGQANQQGNFQHQRPPGPPFPVAPVNSHQSQNYAGRLVMPNSGMNPQTNQQLSGGFAPVSHSNLSQPSSKSSAMEQETSLRSKELVEKVSEVESAKGKETGMSEVVIMNGVDVGKNGLFANHMMKPADHGSGSSLEQASGRKSLAGIQEGKSCVGEDNMLRDSDSKKQVEQSRERLPKSAAEVFGPSSAIRHSSHTSVSASSNEGNLPPKSNSSQLKGSHAQSPGQPPIPIGDHGPGMLHHPGQSFNLSKQREPAYFGPPRNSYDSYGRPPSIPLPDQHGIIGRPQLPHFEGPYGAQYPGRSSEAAIVKDPGSVEGTSRLGHGSEPTFMRMNGGRAPDSSMFGSRDETLKTFPREEHLNPFPMNPTQALDRAPGSIDKAPHGPNDDARSKFQHGGSASNSRLLPPHGRMDNFGPRPEFSLHNMRNFATRSPEREYRGGSPRAFSGPSNFPRGAPGPDDINGREPHKFGEGSRTFNHYPDPTNPFQDSRFPTLPPHLCRGHVDGPGNMRFDEHMAHRPPLSDNRRIDAFGLDGPGHLMRGAFSGPGKFSGPSIAAEVGGPNSYHVRPRATDIGGPGNFSGIRINNSPGQGFPNAGNFAGAVNPFDPSRNGRPMTVEWCRLCNIEAVNGLDEHSQQRGHQKIALDIVENIKQQNRRKQRGSTSHNKHSGGKGRKFGHEFRGN